jgi:plastocyanin
LRLRLISLVALIAALAVSGIAVASSSTSKITTPLKITVTLRDYSFSWSRNWAPVGRTVIFTVKNAGTVQHNVDFTSLNKRSAIISPGTKTTLKITFKKKGTIQIVCDVPRHIQLGMVSSFRVKAA